MWLLLSLLLLCVFCLKKKKRQIHSHVGLTQRRRPPQNPRPATPKTMIKLRARLRLGLASGTSNDSPCAPPRCGGAPAAVRTHPEHAPDGPDTGGHRPGPPGRAPGAGAMGSPSTTTSQHHSRGCCKRQSVFAPTSSVVNRKRIKRSFWENPSCNHENPACLRYGATNSSLLRWFSADVARNG